MQSIGVLFNEIGHKLEIQSKVVIFFFYSSYFYLSCNILCYISSFICFIACWQHCAGFSYLILKQTYKIQVEMIEFLLLLVGILAYLYYSLVFKPKKLYNFYAQTMESLGYKVLKLPFKPFQIPFFEQCDNNFQKHKDAFFFIKNNTQKYDFVLHNIMSGVQVDLVNPNLIRELLSMQKIFIFPKEKTYISNLKRLLGDGTLTSEGSTWKSQRKIISSILTFDFLKSIIPKISKICDLQFQKAEKGWKIQNPKDKGSQFFMRQMGFDIFSNIMMISFFGMESIQSTQFTIQGKSPCEFLKEALNQIDEQGTDPLGYLLGPWVFGLGLMKRDRKVKQMIKIFRGFATSLINKKIQILRSQKQQSNRQYSDLIEAFVIHYHLGSQEQNKKQNYSIDNVVDQFCTLFQGGTDTTSHFFMMMIYYVVETPEVQARLRRQIGEIFKTQDDMTFENLKKMKFIDCIQEEVTRIYGPVNGVILRQAIKDTQLLNVPIKKGTFLSIRPAFNHYSSELFEEPQKFMPERWQKPNELHPYTIMGFSGGPRACLGKHLAMLESKIALIKLLQRYKTIELQKHISEWQMNYGFLYFPNEFMTRVEK